MTKNSPMMEQQPAIEIRKLSLSRKKAPKATDNFLSVPPMFLELIENKNKVKQNLINQPYHPTVSQPHVPHVPMSTYLDELIQHKHQNNHQQQKPKEEDEKLEPKEKSIEKSTESEPSSDEEDGSISDSDSEGDDVDDDDDDDDEPQRPSQQRPSTPIPSSQQFLPKRIPLPIIKEQPSSQPTISQPSIPTHIPVSQPPPTSHISQPPVSQPPQSQPKLLRDLGSTSEIAPGFKLAPPPQIPSLKDINLPKAIPNLAYMNDNAEEDNNKRELLFKFELLKKSYKDVKDAKIPEFSMLSDYKLMKQTYEQTVRRLSIDKSVDSYKTYLMGGFMVVEFILGNWMGFDMEGFTQHQITTLGSYDRLLVELGEKSFVDEESQWPVEVRLLGMIIMNAAFFILSKLVTKKTGASNILSFFSSLNTAQSEPKKTRPMKGPKMDFSSIPTFT